MLPLRAGPSSAAPHVVPLPSGPAMLWERTNILPVILIFSFTFSMKIMLAFVLPLQNEPFCFPSRKMCYSWKKTDFSSCRLSFEKGDCGNFQLFICLGDFQSFLFPLCLPQRRLTNSGEKTHKTVNTTFPSLYT